MTARARRATLARVTVRRSGDLVFALLMIGGLLMVQSAWGLVVPPFRGLDEHEHAYKAAAVAGGDWSPDHAGSPDGWGWLVSVPEDIVLAANPVCEQFPYTTPDNCTPGERSSDGAVMVASSAASYNPVFYFVPGLVAGPFEGADALYAMRAASAALCALLLALGFVALRSWATSFGPAAAGLLAATPMLLYSTSIFAPNGIEAAAAFLMWAALLGIVRSPDHESVRKFIVLATVGAVPLAFVRGLGPLWLLLITVTVATLMPKDRIFALVCRKDTLFCSAIVLVAGLGGIDWTLRAQSVAVGTAVKFAGSPWPGMPARWASWFVESIGVFPARDELAPLSLYAIVLAAGWIFLAMAWRTGDWRHRKALILVLFLATAVPVAMTVTTYAHAGAAWQGRYGFPYSMGFILICGLMLDRGEVQHRRLWLRPATVWAVALISAAINLIGSLAVLANENRDSPLAGSSAWHTPSIPTVLMLMSAGFLLLAWTITHVSNGPALKRSPA